MKPQKPNVSAEFDHMRRQINNALDVLKEKGLPPAEAMPEIIKFVAALSLKANGVVVTIDGLRDLVDQLDGLMLSSYGVGNARS